MFYEEAGPGRWRCDGPGPGGRTAAARKALRYGQGGAAQRNCEDVERGCPSGGRSTRRAFLTDWLGREVEAGQSVNTIENYRWAVEGHPCIGAGLRRLANTADQVGPDARSTGERASVVVGRCDRAGACAGHKARPRAAQRGPADQGPARADGQSAGR